jgi:protein SCO1/2
MNMILRLVCAALVALTALPAAAASAGELPTDSVYHLDVATEDQRGVAGTFAQGRGGVRIVSMFYANCPYVCPMIVETIRRTESALEPAQRERLSVLLLTLDPARDDPAALAKVALQRRLDARWTLARTAPDDVRKLAAVLGIQYRQLENREFNHSSALILLDADGRVLARSSTLGETDPAFLDAVRAALGG